MFERSTNIAEKLKDAGLRPTRQRIMLGLLLWAEDGLSRHVTAEQLHQESMQSDMPVSLATVYNTLHQFKKCKLVREVMVDSSRSYFDTNTDAHHHFFNESTGMLSDVEHDALQVLNIPNAPEGTCIKNVEVIIRVE